MLSSQLVHLMHTLLVSCQIRACLCMPTTRFYSGTCLGLSCWVWADPGPFLAKLDISSGRCPHPDALLFLPKVPSGWGACPWLEDI